MKWNKWPDVRPELETNCLVTFNIILIGAPLTYKIPATYRKETKKYGKETRINEGFYRNEGCCGWEMMDGQYIKYWINIDSIPGPEEDNASSNT